MSRITFGSTCRPPASPPTWPATWNGNCQLLCRPDPAERKELYRLLTTSGCVIQQLDGALERVSPEEAERHVAALEEGERALYC